MKAKRGRHDHKTDWDSGNWFSRYVVLRTCRNWKRRKPVNESDSVERETGNVENVHLSER